MSIPRGAMATLFAAVMLLPAAAAVSADTVPHEEFDEAELDLLSLKLLLDESLRRATESVLACVQEDAESAQSYSSSLLESIEPPAAIIDDLSDEADSYEYLVTFIPPFEQLALDDSELASTFASLMENITALRLIADYAIVPPETYEQAMDLLAQTNAHIQELLIIIDWLEDDALAIDDLPEMPEQGDLNVTPLLEAIDNLRDKLQQLDGELDRLAENVLNPTPRLFLLANSDELHLGETLVLTGYLFYWGTFIPDLEVSIDRNGTLFSTADTGASGRLVETYLIPMDGAELGSWTYAAQTVYDNETYTSSDLVVNVTRIPTVIELEVAPEYELGSAPTLNGTLEDFEGRALLGQEVHVWLDGTLYPAVTESDGSFQFTLLTLDLGFGPHSAYASYDGNETHAPSSTVLYEFMLRYPAVITLHASEEKVELGDEVILSGTFSNSSGEPIGNATIWISLNGVRYALTTTGPDGSISAAVDTDDIGIGTHVANAEHDDDSSPWFRTVSNDVEFTVENGDSGFLPGIITNPDRLFEAVKDLLEAWFLGEYWYIAWASLAILTISAYLVYRRLRVRSERRREQEEQLKKALLLEPPIVTPKVRPLASLPAGPRKLTAATLWKMIDSLLGSMAPREAIVHGYSRFLQFLAKERSTLLDDSLTHREIQSELVFMGYPKETVGSVTGVYEKAMYTKREVTVEDALEFADSLAVLEGFGKVVPE